MLIIIAESPLIHTLCINTYNTSHCLSKLSQYHAHDTNLSKTIQKTLSQKTLPIPCYASEKSICILHKDISETQFVLGALSSLFTIHIILFIGKYKDITNSTEKNMKNELYTAHTVCHPVDIDKPPLHLDMLLQWYDKEISYSNADMYSITRTVFKFFKTHCMNIMLIPILHEKCIENNNEEKLIAKFHLALKTLENNVSHLEDFLVSEVLQSRLYMLKEECIDALHLSKTEQNNLSSLFEGYILYTSTEKHVEDIIRTISDTLNTIPKNSDTLHESEKMLLRKNIFQAICIKLVRALH